MINRAWPEKIAATGRERREVPAKQGSGSKKSGKVFRQGQKTAKTIRAGLYGERPANS
jgi:hypothetical protein